MWTRLVAGAAAHDINNLAQGLSNLLALASSPTANRESLDRYASLARDGLKDLRLLATNLRSLANAQSGVETQRLDLLAADVVTELGTTGDRGVDLSPPDPGALVEGPGPALRLAIHSLVRYGLAASAPRARIAVTVSREDRDVVVVVTAPSSPPPRTPDEAELGALLGGAEREFGGDAGLVLAGASAHLLGGRATAGPAPGGGLRFKLSLPRAEEAQREGAGDVRTT
jgi:signal transduction histidine kinase